LIHRHDFEINKDLYILVASNQKKSAIESDDSPIEFIWKREV